jgi:uncharacterized DUF497 family protein
VEFDGFNWDSGNREKCQKHGVSIAEIKSRKVFVVFTLRNHDDGVLIRPISARYMHKREVESYEKNYPDV